MEGYHGYLLFAWMYGAFVGGLNFSLATFVLERSRIRHFARDWGFVQGRRQFNGTKITSDKLFIVFLRVGNQMTQFLSSFLKKFGSNFRANFLG